jgi:PDZ domain-containing protein
MVSSQELAAAAALTTLGEVVGLKVNGRASAQAQQILADGDVLLALNGQSLTDFADLQTKLAEIPGGQTVTLTVQRADKELELTMGTDKAADGSAKLGIYVGFALPVDVRFGLDNVGGSSAGLMFALAIIDKLGPVDLADGQVIAGTGTINAAGDVGPIGGIQQKVYGALHDGAKFFLAPADNCQDLQGGQPKDLKIIKVASLAEALAALAAVRDGEAENLPGCR